MLMHLDKRFIENNNKIVDQSCFYYQIRNKVIYCIYIFYKNFNYEKGYIFKKNIKKYYNTYTLKRTLFLYSFALMVVLIIVLIILVKK